MPRLPIILSAPLFLAAMPAHAQLFLKPPEVPGGVMMAPEKGYGFPLPGATAAENRAVMVWNLRSALNVAALQCGLDPFINIAGNYNVMLGNHRDELNAAFATMSGYFKRKNKSARVAQTAIDQYGTRTYSSYSAVGGLLPFCHTSAQVVRSAIFTPRGQLYTVAESRLRQVHNAVNFRKGEQQFSGIAISNRHLFPRLEDKCWKKKNYITKCGYSYN